MGKLLQEVDKRTTEDKLKDAPSPDFRFSNADIRRRLDNFRGEHKPPPPLPLPDDFDSPSPPSGDINEDDNRPLPPPPPTQLYLSSLLNSRLYLLLGK